MNNEHMFYSASGGEIITEKEYLSGLADGIMKVCHTCISICAQGRAMYSCCS